MFEGSSGSISPPICTATTIASAVSSLATHQAVSSLPVFSPKSRAELKSAVDAYLDFSAKKGWFRRSHDHHGPIAEWDVSRVADMSQMFAGARSFNGDISKWDVSRVTDMSAMFLNAQSFNGDISNWDVSSVQCMAFMFFDATYFNGDISNWDVSSVQDMDSMFFDARSFNSDISQWDVSSVTNMPRILFSAESFNGDISKWDVSSVQDMSGMFSSALLFNGDISKWDVSSVQDMCLMFVETSFNGDLSKWDVSSVTDMTMMFYKAPSFTQKLCTSAWVHSEAVKTRMFDGSTGSISPTLCTLPTALAATVPERELIARLLVSTASISSTIARPNACAKCGTFAKSGRSSCCAPGGAWYKDCGDAVNRNVKYRWFEGAKACRRKFQAICM